MRRIGFSVVLFLLLAVPVLAQSYPEVDALLDAACAKDVETVMKHLPASVQKALSELPAHERAQVGQQFLVTKSMSRDGVSITRTANGETLAIIEQNGEAEAGAETETKRLRIEVTLEKRISDGYESVLRLKLRRVATDERHNAFTLLAWMRFEDGEWRILQLQPNDTNDRMDFEDPKFIASIRSSHAGANEASAVGSVRTYVTACITYAASNPEIGYPRTLQSLGGDGQSPEHSGLVDTLLSTPPDEKSGYRFTYRLVKHGAEDGFTIVARPIEVGTTGTRSFFADETGVIRYTEEDREPTSSDQPLD